MSIRDKRGITYIITRETEHPTIAGRKMLHLKRENGTKTYVATRYENGNISSIEPNPFS